MRHVIRRAGGIREITLKLNHKSAGSDPNALSRTESAAESMCGIAGYIGEAGPLTLQRMTRDLAHRGPDGEGYYTDLDNRAALGHRRLAILDLDGGKQPMANEDGTVVVTYNGEI